MAKKKSVANESSMATEITLFTPGLQDTEGWEELGREKQDEMLKITDRLLQFQSMEGLGIVGQCVELARAREALEGQAMNITNYTASVFRQGFRTAWRRLAEFEEWKKCLPKENQDLIPQIVAEKGSLLLRGAAGGGMGGLIKAFRALKSRVPKRPSRRKIESFIAKDVREYLREERRGRNKSEREPVGKNVALREAFGGVLKMMGRTRYRSTEQQRIWLTSLAGMLMQSRNIPGTIHVGRLPIPDGFVVKRGPKPRRGRKPKQDQSRDFGDFN